MKKLAFLFALLIAAQVLALDKSTITVKNTTVSGDVVLVTIQESGKTYELQCTKGAPNCSTPQPGTYWMVRLPKNHGYYDCANVDLYVQSADPEHGGPLFAEYCISEK
ncbi:MAG TPA: hypothetical protein VEI26_08345 [Terriglobales bacterium]|nr:hypothetical protein [Terriglobales bacterium]